MPFAAASLALPRMHSSTAILASAAAAALCALWRLAFPLHHSLDPSKLVIVITGCDSGFGLMASELLAKRGFLVVSACLTEEGAIRLSSKVSTALKCDVTDAQDIQLLHNACVQIMVENHAKLWAIVNNAGIAPLGCLDWMPMRMVEKVMDVNYLGSVRVIKALLPLLKPSKHSRIINISSVAGLLGAQLMGSYCASKHAIEGMMKVLREELSPWNIHVGSINPITTNTPLIESSMSQMMRLFDEAPVETQVQYNPADFFRNKELLLASMLHPDTVVDAIVHCVYAKSISLNYVVAGYFTPFIRVFMALPRSVQEFLTMAVPILGVKRDAIKTIQCDSLGK